MHPAGAHARSHLLLLHIDLLHQPVDVSLEPAGVCVCVCVYVMVGMEVGDGGIEVRQKQAAAPADSCQQLSQVLSKRMGLSAVQHHRFGQGHKGGWAHAHVLVSELLHIYTHTFIRKRQLPGR